MTSVKEVAEEVFREEYGRVFASLVRAFGDFDVVEEAIQEAFATAVDRWNLRGLPDNPAAWITVTAKRKAIDRGSRPVKWCKSASSCCCCLGGCRLREIGLRKSFVEGQNGGVRYRRPDDPFVVLLSQDGANEASDGRPG